MIIKDTLFWKNPRGIVINNIQQETERPLLPANPLGDLLWETLSGGNIYY